MAGLSTAKAMLLSSGIGSGLNALNGSVSSGGSSQGSTQSASSWSNTAGREASVISQMQAGAANTSALNAWREAAEYNARQAEIQRQWQERMSNTVYQRTVEDMKKAGINPVLAAGMGLGTASVGSGATASMTSPNTFMGQTFAEQNAASNSSANSWGSSWQSSESGLATGLKLLGQSIGGVANSLNDALTSSGLLDTFDQYMNGIKDQVSDKGEKAWWISKKAGEIIQQYLQNRY